VTVEEIARQAGVSYMTFYRHFSTKESVVFDDPFDPVIGELIAGQDENLPAFERARTGIVQALSLLDENDDFEIRRRIRLAKESPALRARILENNLRTEAPTSRHFAYCVNWSCQGT
jgi:AcrR family transcriptional regulator